MKNHNIKVNKIGAEWCVKCHELEWDNYIDIDKATSEEQNKYQQVFSDYGLQEMPVITIEDDGKVISATYQCLNKDDALLWSTKEIMHYLAKQYNYKESEHFPKIAAARVRMKLDWNRCPCGGEGRGCISDLCRSEIEKEGHCHCNCFLKK